VSVDDELVDEKESSGSVMGSDSLAIRSSCSDGATEETTDRFAARERIARGTYMEGR
jgi:hypothetical protein